MKIRIRKLEDHTFGSVLCESVDQIRWSVPLRIPTVMSSLFDPAAHSDGCPSQIGNQQKTKTLVQKDEEKGVCRFTKTKTKTNTNTKTKTNTDQTDCRKPTLLCRMTRMKKEDFQNWSNQDSEGGRSNRPLQNKQPGLLDECRNTLPLNVLQFSISNQGVQSASSNKEQNLFLIIRSLKLRMRGKGGEQIEQLSSNLN